MVRLHISIEERYVNYQIHHLKLEQKKHYIHREVKSVFVCLLIYLCV